MVSGTSLRPLGTLILVISLCSWLVGVTGCSFVSPSVAAVVVDPSKLRGVWVQAKSLASQERIDEMLDRAESGHFNAIFVNVFENGQAWYDSSLVRTSDKVKSGFNPLAYLIPEAHRHGIAVHAWFVVGPVGDDEEDSILQQHPEWRIVGPDGQSAAWLNFTRPDVQEFVRNLMLEVVERYDVDGVHFDYTRYPGPEWGFDPYSVATFTEEYDLDLNELRYADLPAYGLFEGNPLANPSSAHVLATFASGVPAVATNTYGAGEVVLLNYDAAKRSVAFGSNVLHRSLQHLLDSGGDVYILGSEHNARKYGYDGFNLGMAWLKQLGWTPTGVADGDVPGLPTDSVLVLPNVYLISDRTAEHLADFAQRGGGIIFIDGPSPSIKNETIQRLTGMQSKGGYFREVTLISPNGEHPLIPMSNRSSDIDWYRQWDTRWQQFRQQGINDLVRSVSEQVKESRSSVAVSVTITSNQDKATSHVLQDWRAWLEGTYVDFIVPRGYVEEPEALKSVITTWQSLMQQDSRITLGLKIFHKDGKSATPKSADQLLTEVALAANSGSNGIMLFDLDRMTDAQLQALARGPFPLVASSGEE